MNREFFGDALDAYKERALRIGFSLECAKADKLRSAIRIAPLLTDERWEDPEPTRYAQLVLGKEASKELVVVHDKPYKSKSNESYLDELLKGLGDAPNLFLDPDTGMETKGGTVTDAHVSFDSVQHLLGANGKPGTAKVVAVYQHAIREGRYVCGIIDRAQQKGLVSVAHYGGAASMLFFAADIAALKQVYENLQRELDPPHPPCNDCASKRVYRSWDDEEQASEALKDA